MATIFESPLGSAMKPLLPQSRPRKTSQILPKWGVINQGGENNGQDFDRGSARGAHM